MNREKELLKNTGIYLVANFGSKILVFILYPIYTFYLAPEQLGEYDFIISAMNLIIPIISCCFHEGAMRWLLSGEESYSHIVKSNYLILTIDLVLVLICAVVGKIYQRSDVILYCALLYTTVLYISIQSITRGLKGNIVYAVSGVVYTVFLVSMSVFFLRVANYGIQGLFYAQIIASVIACIYMVIVQRDKLVIKQRGKSKVFYDILKYSILLVPNNINWWILNASDRVLIKYFIGDSENGIYAISYKFPSIMNMFTSVFYLAWQEQSIGEYNAKDRNLYFTRIFKMYYMILTVGCYFLILLTKYILPIITNAAYHNAWKYTSFLYVSSVFYALASCIGTKFLSEKNTKIIGLTSTYAALINIVVNILFLDKIRLYAAAASTLVAFFVLLIVRVYKSKDVLYIDVSFIFCIVGIVSLSIIVLFTNLCMDIILGIIGIIFCFWVIEKCIVTQRRKL